MSAWKILLDQNVRYEVKEHLNNAGIDVSLPLAVYHLLYPFLNSHTQEDVQSSLVIITKNKARIIR